MANKNDSFGKHYESFRYDGKKNFGKLARKSYVSERTIDGKKNNKIGYDTQRITEERKNGRRNYDKKRNLNEKRPVRSINLEYKEYGTINSERDVYRPANHERNEYKLASADANEKNYILTGRNPIREALKTNRDLEKLLVQKGELSGSAMEIVKTAKDRKIMVQVVDKSRLDEIAPNHQGLIAFASAFQYSTVEIMLEKAKEQGEDPFLILLDGVTDPHNFGAIIRCAECAGAHGIIVPQHRSVGLTPAAVKASAGAVEYIPIARVTNLNRTIEELQEKNIWVYALTMKGKDYEEVTFSGGVALVIGSEGDGISKLTAEKCDESVSLPMKGHLDSLNASVAAGVIMYRVMSSKKKGK